MSRISAWGNSHGVRLPRDVLEEAGIPPNADVTIRAESGRILIEPVKSELADRFGEGTIQMEMAAALSDSMQLIGLALLVGSLLTALSLLTPEIRLSLRTRRG